MNAVYLFLVEASITVLPGALILVVWSKSLRRVLLDLSGTESRANFWLVYSNIMLLLTPLLFVFLFGLLAGVDIELATVLLAITLGGIGLWGGGASDHQGYPAELSSDNTSRAETISRLRVSGGLYRNTAF